MREKAFRRGEKIAIGLHYDPTREETPEVSVVGFEETAQEIVRAARRFGVPVVENTTLATELSAVAEENPIPERLFSAVAKLFVQTRFRQ